MSERKKFDDISNYVVASFVEANAMIDEIRKSISKTKKEMKAGKPVSMTAEDCGDYDRLISIFYGSSDPNIQSRAKNLDKSFSSFNSDLDSYLKKQNANSEIDRKL